MNEKYTVLIIDDSKSINAMITRMLQEEGLDTISAFDAREAFVHLDAFPIDLILLDVVLPDMNGLQVCRKIKENPKNYDIPILFLSGVSDKENVIQGFTYGAVDYIHKPFDKAELMARIKVHLELKTAHERIRSSEAELLEKNAVREKFISILAHDLKNSLAGVIDLSTLITAKKPSIENILKYNGIINEYAKKSSDLLENLLQWAKAQSGKIQLNKENLKLHESVISTLDFLNGQANRKNIQVSMNVIPGTTVYTDRNILATILRNLIGNAIKFTPAKGLITIKAKDEVDKVEIQIVDTGIGISPEGMEQLFAPNYDKVSQGTQNETGHGLGLSICKELVEASGGKIWATSELKIGSTFCFTIPKN